MVLRYIDLFAGIGGMRIPFDELGYQCVFASEWDGRAQQTYQANFQHCPAGDITAIPSEAIPAHDVLLAGFPCQAFSIMGHQRGFEDTRGTLFFEVARILAYHRPRAFLLENVKQLQTHDHGRTFATILATLRQLGYAVRYAVLNALDFGLPQKRERTIIVGFLDAALAGNFSLEFATQPYSLASLLEPEASIPQEVFASPAIQQKRHRAVEGKKRFSPSVWHENKGGSVSIHDYSCALRANASYNYLLVDGRRRFTCRELLRLQGFPEWFRVVVSPAQLRRQVGNSVPVPMIRAVAKRIDRCLMGDSPFENAEAAGRAAHRG